MHHLCQLSNVKMYLSQVEWITHILYFVYWVIQGQRDRILDYFSCGICAAITWDSSRLPPPEAQFKVQGGISKVAKSRHVTNVQSTRVKHGILHFLHFFLSKLILQIASKLRISVVLGIKGDRGISTSSCWIHRHLNRDPFFPAGLPLIRSLNFQWVGNILPKSLVERYLCENLWISFLTFERVTRT